jgi:peroxiredoxin
MQKFLSAILLFILAVSTLAIPLGPVPRQSPELSFFSPEGKALSLSRYKGKVVALEFFFVGSMHCVRVAQVLNQLNGELGARGFQAVAVAFSAPHSEADAGTVSNFIESYRLSFPIGYTDQESVDRFMDRVKGDQVNIPQVVIIDRAGTIRAQSGNRPGDPKLEDGDSLRALLGPLLKENPPATPPAAPKSKSKQLKSSRVIP